VISFFPYGAHAQDLSSGDLLKKIAETYRQISSFSAVAEKKLDYEAEAGYIGPSGNLEGSQMSYDIQVTLMASSPSKAKLLLRYLSTKILVVCDGKVVWTSFVAQHTYTEVAAGCMNKQLAAYPFHVEGNEILGVDLLEEYETLFATRFQSMSGYESWAKLERSEILKVGKDKKECYVLTIQKPRSAQKQKLWVDKTEFTIWKCVDTTVGPWGAVGGTLWTTRTVTIEQMTLNPSLDDSNFVFTPPDKAQKVDSLILTGSNPF